MGRTQKIVTTVLWSVLVLTMVAVVGAGLFARREARAKRAAGDSTSSEPAILVQVPQNEAERLAPRFRVPKFELTDQEGRTVRDIDLRGSTWVAAFIFTSCGADCPMMSQKLTDLQERMRGTDLKIVSFTLDPERDTPAVLKKYAANLGADESRWHFLTGPKQTMFDTALAMQVGASPATATSPITHGDWFLLVDADGMVRGHYRSKEKDSVDRLAADAKTVAAEGAAKAAGAPS